MSPLLEFALIYTALGLAITIIAWFSRGEGSPYRQLYFLGILFSGLGVAAFWVVEWPV